MLKHEFVHHNSAPSFYEALWKFTTCTVALEMEKKMSKGKAAQIQTLKRQYLSLWAHKPLCARVCAFVCVCVCVSRKMIELLLFAGDIEVKDTKINAVQVQLRDTESKYTAVCGLIPMLCGHITMLRKTDYLYTQKECIKFSRYCLWMQASLWVVQNWDRETPRRSTNFERLV